MIRYRNVINDKPSIYYYNNSEDHETRKYFPVNSCLQQIAGDLVHDNRNSRPWEAYYDEGLRSLKEFTDSDFTRPAANTDKLYMHIGNGEVIEVQHPQPADIESADRNASRLHLGPIGSGKEIIRSDTARIEFAHQNGLLATDLEMSSVLDSIIGNCRDSFILIKGM